MNSQPAHGLDVLLQNARRRAGLTQEQLAGLSTVSVRAIRDLEVGRVQHPRRDTLKLLANAMRLSDARRVELELAVDTKAVGRAFQDSYGADLATPPPALRPLVGRRPELEALTARLSTDHERLLTLVGLPGVGKSRQAQEAASVIHARDRVPVLWVSLDDPANITEMGTGSPQSTVAGWVRALVRDGGEFEELATLIGSKETLIVLDSHDASPDVTPHVTPRLLNLLRSCERLKILTTSDRPVQLPGGRLLPLAPLAVPSAAELASEVSGDTLVTDTPAVELTLSHVSYTRPDFLPTDTVVTTVAHICRYLPDTADGLGQELCAISEVDRAHLIVLTERGIVDRDRAAALLRAIEELRGQDFAPVRARPMPRGVHLACEGPLIEQLGERTGGILHTGRSRNDLNATTTRLKVRGPYLALIDAADRLAGVLLDKAGEYQGVVMPAYTHGQPAVPIGYGHYLAGVAGAVLRASLLDAGRQIDVNPLGAGAIGGTSVPIDPRRTAELLGFSSAAPNSVDAVASRDFVLDLLSASAVLGVALARTGQDLSTWTSEEFGLLRVGDTLVGSSSMMPQKRNPFLLEHIQGRSAASLGAFVGAATAMTTGGYTNAIAVGTEAAHHLWPGLSDTTDAVTLLNLVVAGTEPEPERERMTERAVDGFTSATYLAERLVLDGTPFRSAHHLVGETVLGALDSGRSLVDAARLPAVEDGGLAPGLVAQACAHGGGPGSTADGTSALATRRDVLKAELTARRTRWSDGSALLNRAVLEAVTS
uniref:argininosuccinate lyase n=1 Tax=Streptomyces sp. NBC_00008 TaxID=2903610 RepID=A0AAU2W0J1_9ACTN